MGDSGAAVVDGDDILGGTFCPSDGIASPHGVTSGYAGVARRLGVKILEGVAVTAIDVRQGRVRAVRTSAGEIMTSAVFDCAGAASAIPFGRFFAAHQHSVNVKVTSVIGPPVPAYVLGARILDILPITRLFGNVGLTLAAFSYSGRMSLVVTADSTTFPDFDVLLVGMERDWDGLAGTGVRAHALGTRIRSRIEPRATIASK